jgi:transposase
LSVWYTSKVAANRPQRVGAESFTAPTAVNHRRYEALRAYYVEGLTLQQVADRFGYTRWAMVNLVRQHRNDELSLFAPPAKPGPKSAPRKDRVRERVIELRRQGRSVYEISRALAVEGTPLNRTGVGEILAEEGFGRLLRGPEPDVSVNPATTGRDTRLPAARVIDFAAFPDRFDTQDAR